MFQKISMTDRNDTSNHNSKGKNKGNFPQELRKFFNECGEHFYCGKILFNNLITHQRNKIPIFTDSCLKSLPDTYDLLKQLRKHLKASDAFQRPQEQRENAHKIFQQSRSIHQNDTGNLPFRKGGAAGRGSVYSKAIYDEAKEFGKLPHNQAKLKLPTYGQFMEYTFHDNFHQLCRLILDFRFGIVYMTCGHYHEKSLALLVRSEVELRFEIRPILPALMATYEE